MPEDEDYDYPEEGMPQVPLDGESIETKEEFQPAYMGGADPQLIKWQMEINVELEQMAQVLRGKFFDPNKKELVELTKPLINELGIRMLLLQLQMRLTRFIILSDLDRRDVEGMTLKFSANMIDLLSVKQKEFAIEKSNLSIIKDMIVDPVYVTLCRAIGGGERRFLKGSFQNKEVYGTKQAQKKSFWDKMNVHV